MKVITWLCLVILGFSISACQFGSSEKIERPDIFTDTVTYASKRIYQRAADCGDKPDSTCTVVDIRYPEFKDQAQLNDTVKSKLLTIFSMDGKADTSLESMSKNFLKAYADFKKSDPKSVMFYTLNTYAKVIQQDTSLISLEYGGYIFQGGAHGGAFTGYVNWNPDAKKEVTLKDILISGYEAKLTRTADSIFRKNEKLSATASLKTNYFFKDDKFALNNNYSITPLGIKFMYNQYEIKPYAAGQTELFIPYSQIRTLVRSNSVAAQYINKNAGI
jgi:hypothetical protein